MAEAKKEAERRRQAQLKANLEAERERVRKLESQLAAQQRERLPTSVSPIPTLDDTKHAPKTEPSTAGGIRWAEIDQIYNLRSKRSNLQKDDLWKKYKGKRVQWTGTVTSVSQSWGSLTLQVKMNPDTWTSDLMITLRKGEKSKALTLSEGDRVTFRGILDRWGTLMIRLRDGQIVR